MESNIEPTVQASTLSHIWSYIRKRMNICNGTTKLNRPLRHADHEYLSSDIQNYALLMEGKTDEYICKTTKRAYEAESDLMRHIEMTSNITVLLEAKTDELEQLQEESAKRIRELEERLSLVSAQRDELERKLYRAERERARMAAYGADTLLTPS